MLYIFKFDYISWIVELFQFIVGSVCLGCLSGVKGLWYVSLPMLLWLLNTMFFSWELKTTAHSLVFAEEWMEEWVQDLFAAPLWRATWFCRLFICLALQIMDQLCGVVEILPLLAPDGSKWTWRRKFWTSNFLSSTLLSLVLAWCAWILLSSTPEPWSKFIFHQEVFQLLVEFLKSFSLFLIIFQSMLSLLLNEGQDLKNLERINRLSS